MRTHLVVGVVALSAIAAAGCGGSSRSSDHRAFDAQLNSLCSQTRAALKAASSESAQLAVDETYNKKFESVTPPSELKSMYDQWNSVNTQILVALKRHDTAKAKSLNSQSDTLASSLGANKCLSTSTG